MADLHLFSSMAIVLTTICASVTGQASTTCTTLSPLGNFCAGRPYNSTFFPNILGNTNADDASLEVHTFYPLVKIECSDVLKDFLCSAYFPYCNQEIGMILPCKQTCLSARLGCETILNKFGFTWPAKLNCERFQDQSETTPCMYFKSNMTTTTTTTTTQSITTTTSQLASTQYCDNLPYSTPSFPNFLGHRSFQDALGNFEKFDRMLWLGCSQKLSQYLCLLHFPTSDEATNKTVPPCWEFCLKVRTECLLMLPVPWPKSFSCESLPSKITPGSKCYGEDFSLHSTSPTSVVFAGIGRFFGIL